MAKKIQKHEAQNVEQSIKVKYPNCGKEIVDKMLVLINPTGANSPTISSLNPPSYKC